MSSVADLFDDLNAFVQSLDELLNTQTAKEAPNIARDLGAAQQLNEALQFFIDALKKLAEGIASLAGPLAQADSVAAALEIVAASLVDLGDGQALRELTTFFQLPDAPFAPVLDGVKKAGAYLQAGLGLTNLLPGPSELQATHQRLQHLIDSLGRLQAQPALPSPQTA
jgi:hypothetical protein